MKTLSLAVIPGDGVGKEVVPAAIQVMREVEKLHGGLKFELTEFPWNCEYYLKHGRMMPENGYEILASFDAIFLGAIGSPSVPDHVSLWQMLIPIRRRFQQYVNLRPVKLLGGIESPLRNKKAGDFDFVVVRENNEGEYSNIGGRIHTGTPYEAAIQESYFSRMGVDRILRYAFELARNSRRQRLAVATKSNGIIYTMPFWDEICKEVAKEYPGVQMKLDHIDAMAAFFVLKPEYFDVVVASNLFGDILTDIGGAIMGGIGMAPAANINPERKFPSMFEPVHGSAPDIAGKGIANPIGQIWTLKLMLDFFGENQLGDLILKAIEDALESGLKTPDLGGKVTTSEVTQAITSNLRKK